MHDPMSQEVTHLWQQSDGDPVPVRFQKYGQEHLDQDGRILPTGWFGFPDGTERQLLFEQVIPVQREFSAG